MPRKSLIRSQEHPYHVTGRANNREDFPLAIEDLWKVFVQQIHEIQNKFEVKIHAFVLMNNHFHLVISTPSADLGVAMKQFMQSVTKIINHRARRSGRVFGARYGGSLIDCMDYFDCAVKYTYRNPVKAGLCDDVSEYKFSTIRSIVEHNYRELQLSPPLGESHIVPHQNTAEYLKWLNIPFRSEDEQRIREGFKKHRFVVALPRTKKKAAQENFLKVNRPPFRFQL